MGSSTAPQSEGVARVSGSRSSRIQAFWENHLTIAKIAGMQMALEGNPSVGEFLSVLVSCHYS